ncbi:nucleotide kinase [Lysinibacillus yapensis]|uniref:Nucleotide kinase n=2 Tax=Ureibacillus yapensis TaxID=2304605 RepID=A0A396SLF4_9BACL|nr:nucleotide kinase [Lysinibacillus yapensis]
MNEAKSIYLLEGAQGFKVSEKLLELGDFYSKKGIDVEYYHDPFFEKSIQALFIKKPHDILILEATNLSLDPLENIQVISLDGCMDHQKILEQQKNLEYLKTRKEEYYQQCFQSLSNALKLHDEWEVETRRYMDWAGLDAKIDELIGTVLGNENIKKSGEHTHRLLGTLTPAGARDYVQSITQNLEKRLFIKGYPGTGKSSMMKKLAEVALERGFDVQTIWCGLDSKSVDMVILPELKWCIFDSTEPHEYFPERAGDEIFDMASLCHPTAVEEANIQAIVSNYRATMKEAVMNANLYAESERMARQLLDEATNGEKLDEMTAGLFLDSV